jgi:hypothetical protein
MGSNVALSSVIRVNSGRKMVVATTTYLRNTPTISMIPSITSTVARSIARGRERCSIASKE